MVWVLGLLTMTALIWLLAGMMATESEAERRRQAESGLHSSTSDGVSSPTPRRRAA